MEDILAKIMKDSSSTKHAAVKKSCLESQELLANQHELMRSPPFEIRCKVLETLHLSLESKYGKLVSHALSGLQRIVWDKSFQSVFESEKEENWLPIQFMTAVESLYLQSDDVQIEILKILLNMTSTHGQSLTSRSIIMLICLCLEAFNSNALAVKTAAQVTINQTLTSFCLMLQETESGAEEQGDESEDESGFNLVESVCEELYPVLHFTCEKLKDINCNKTKQGSPLLLQCILSILQNIKISLLDSSEFINFVWQELCPLLVSLLGSPKTDKNIVSSQKSCEVSDIGRGSGCLAAAPSCQNVNAKTINSIAVELVRLTGSVGSLRPVLESLFHRMLLYPPVQHRLEALKAVKELFSKPELLFQLAAPPLHATSDKDWISLDLDLIKIAIDSLGECCHSSNNSVCYASVSCIAALLKSLEEISCGNVMKEELINCINSQFGTLESSDYKGAKSERWLKTQLRSLIVAKERKDMLRAKLRDIPKPEVPSESSGEIAIEKPNEVECDESDLSKVSVGEIERTATTEVHVENIEEEITVEVSNKEDQKELEVIDVCEETLENTDCVKSMQDKIIPETEVGVDEDEISPDLTKEVSQNNWPDVVTGLKLDISNENPDAVQDIVSPVTESAEDALNYISPSTSEGTPEEFENDLIDVDELPDDPDRLKKIPRTLLGNEDAGKEERERIERLCLARLECAQQERQNARRFVEVLKTFLPELLAIRSSIEADQALQEFSSKYCESLWKSQQTIREKATENDEVPSQITILNADGIYLALYSALLLNLKLIKSEFYSNYSADVPMTEQQFIEEVHGSGVLVYLSATWLAELYQQILAKNLLEEAGYKPISLENSAIVNLLSGMLLGIDAWCLNNISDVDGLGNSLPGSQQLADFRRLEKAVFNSQSSPKSDAGRKFSRRILTCCWDTVLEVLSVLLNGTNSCGISSIVGFLLGTEGAKEEHRRTKDAIAESLDGLQRAAKLCNDLGLQSCCSAVFSQLASASCPLAEDTIFPQISLKKENKKPFKKSLLTSRSKALRLHASQLLSMDVILSKGLELGSHSPDCWKYVFQCCLFVLQLENTYFSGHGNSHSSVSRAVHHAVNQNSNALDFNSSSDYDLSTMPGVAAPLKLEMSEIIKVNKGFAQTSDVIKDHQLLEAIEALSQHVDRLFEEAASRLNLHALITFLVELCAASQVQLFTQSYAKFSCSSSHGSNLLLYHLGEVMLRCARGGRPLVHVMKSWSVVAPHFVEAACHKDSLISKKGVSTIHDIVSALLSSNSELPHFHFNESLFKPFENLLCLELCDADVQEQIVSSICEFVEGCTTEIRSGWRPLFGALRTVQLPSNISSYSESNFESERFHHLRVVLDVFEAFLATDNVFVFAYAAVDCLLCLLKHVNGPVELQDAFSDAELESNEKPTVPLDMCLAALKYLEKCSDILSSMYKIPTCPVFNSAHRIQLHSKPNLVDPVIPELQIIYFEDPESMQNESDATSSRIKRESIEEMKDINTTPNMDEESVSIQSLEKHTGIIHVWYLLLEGLAGTLATCPKQYQSATMESLFNMLRNLKNIPGPEFGIYCVNHLLLPMLQNWLRKTTRLYHGWGNFATNFKQCCGLATDLVVEYISHLSDVCPSKLVHGYGVNLMLQQLFLVLTECVAQPTELISRLGCACIRHTIISAGEYFTPKMWDITCHNLCRACRVSLNSVKQLMVCFYPDSDNFYGDIGEVKVAARRDCTVRESERLRQLSHQVFLLDCQQGGNIIIKSTCVEDDERSFTFLLFPPGFTQNDPDSSVIRVPFCSLVVGLLSHQILLQTLGTILLQGTKYMLPTLMTLLPSESCLSSSAKGNKPGFLSRLSTKQLCMLFKCLEDSYKTACDFDMKPGLKFLVQKVAQTNVAANLYKQAGVSWTIHMVVLFELCMSSGDINLEAVKSNLKSDAHSVSEHEQSDSSLEKQKPNSEEAIKEFILLRHKFKDACETYTEHTIDKEGLPNMVDRMSDQPIFFLAAPADDMSDSLFPSKHNDNQKAKLEDSTDSPSLACYDSSDSEDLAAKDDATKDKIYTLASEHTINSLINEYKKRKNQHSMPSKLTEKLSRKSSSSSRRRSSDDMLPEEIAMQRRNSIMKDGEAQLQVFKQLIQSFLDLHQSLSDELFKAFLPVFFPGIQFLVAYTTDGELRISISEWMQRLAMVCDFFVDHRTAK